VYDRSDVTAFRSFNNSKGKRVLDLLEAGDLRLRYVVVERITVIGFGVNDGGGNGASCVGINVRTDITKLSDMVIASFGDGRNSIGEGKMFIKDESKVASRVSGVK